MRISAKTDRSLIRAGARSTRFVLVRVVAPRSTNPEKRDPVSVAIVLDRSGSMAGEEKFPLARRAVEHALAMLQSQDRFALVSYDDRVDIVSTSACATPETKRRALDALGEIEPRGSTDLASGWLRGCEQAAMNVAQGTITRCLLLTDGLANVGITDRDELSLHAGELRAREVATSTFGVGADFDERLLRDMAHEGGGHFYFIERASQIPELLTSELGEALEVTARGARLQVDLPEDSECEVLNRFRVSRTVDRVATVDLGDLVSEQEISLVLRLTFPRGSLDERITVRLRAGGRDVPQQVESKELVWTYDTHEANDLQPRDREVDREVARLYAARARAEATEANRDGDLMKARVVLERVASRIRSYAGTDRELGDIAMQLDASVADMAEHEMSPMAIKQVMFSSEMAFASRSPTGQAMRNRDEE